MQAENQNQTSQLIPWDSNGQWRNRIILFNLDPLSYIHQDRLLDGPFLRLSNILEKNALARNRLSSILRTELSIDKD